MFGDHAPPIDCYNDLFDENDTNPEHYVSRLCYTPYIIWSNFDRDDSKIKSKNFSLFYFIPTIIELSDLPISQYYNFLLNLRNVVPSISRYHVYYGSDGKALEGEKLEKYLPLLYDYFSFEKLNLDHPTYFKKFFNYNN